MTTQARTQDTRPKDSRYAADFATWEALEEIVGGLEGGEAVAFASGMAAVAAVWVRIFGECRKTPRIRARCREINARNGS
jgi:cystathionine beta-lyase/cystathionine gamma-synthase